MAASCSAAFVLRLPRHLLPLGTRTATCGLQWTRSKTTKEGSMYIGIGTVVGIILLIIILKALGVF
jgi:hypothetical protein